MAKNKTQKLYTDYCKASDIYQEFEFLSDTIAIVRNPAISSQSESEARRVWNRLPYHFKQMLQIEEKEPKYSFTQEGFVKFDFS